MSDTTTLQEARIAAVETEHEFRVQPGPPAPSDLRRFPRHNFRTCIKTVVHPPAGEPGAEAFACQMMTRDISRGGMNVLHKQQLFPGQMIDVTLNDGQERRLEVMWCKRLGVGCYAAGCRFVKAS